MTARAARPRAFELLTEGGVLLAASCLAALVMWTIDLAFWPSVRRPTPFLVSFGLALAIGAGTGVGILCLWTPVRAVACARTRWRYVVPVSLSAIVTLLAAGQALSSMSWARSQFALVLGLVAFAGAVTSALVTWGLVSCVLARERRSWLSIVLLVLLAVALLVLDRTLLSSVFEKTYSFVEATAHLAATLALAGLLRTRPRTMLTFAAGAAIWLAAFVGSRPLRVATERSLPAVWEEPLFAARWLRRIRRIDARSGEARSDLERLREKYALYHDTADEAWQEPSGGAHVFVGSAQPHERDSATSDGSRSNVVVFFVDTLRADVAHDPSVMPETLAWMRENQWFTRAYASGSSTLLTLAPMLGCRYDAKPDQRPLLLDAARAAGMTTALFIPKTAFDYHRGAFPTFRFEHEDVVVDYDKQRVPTATEVVDRALAWLRTERPERFFLWAYQFDAHSWSDLDETYVESHSAEAGFSKTNGIHWRYRAAARGLDRSFTRLRAGLEELGLSKTTTVVFVSDHGEALGQQNFWAHSTYLWESLVRVPLALHVPGEPARALDAPVSTVDLAPTLARFIGAPISSTGCHGQDLLLTSEEGNRRLPILFSAMIDGEIARIGMLESAERKLVVDLRNADARLLRIRDGTSVEEDVSFAEPGDFSLRLRQLLRAPNFPR